MKVIDHLERNKFDRTAGFFGALESGVCTTGFAFYEGVKALSPLFNHESDKAVFALVASAAVPSIIAGAVEGRIAYSVISWGSAAARQEFAPYTKFAHGCYDRIQDACVKTTLVRPVNALVGLAARLG